MAETRGNQTDGRLSNDSVTGAEAAVLSLAQHGVRHVFGLCGDTSLPFYDALARLNHGITHVLSRDERSAGYMADAYARVTGRVGVCEGPSGGGATYILPGVVEANESSSAMACITSDVPVTPGHSWVIEVTGPTPLAAPRTTTTRPAPDAPDTPSSGDPVTMSPRPSSSMSQPTPRYPVGLMLRRRLPSAPLLPPMLIAKNGSR